MNPRIMTAGEAVSLIKDGDILITEGFMGSVHAEELSNALEQRFLQQGQPRNLTLIHAAGQGDGSSNKCDNHFGHEGLLRRVVGGHWNMEPRLQKLAAEGKIEAYNLPQGIICQLYRAAAAHQPGVITKVGLGTFVDPVLGCGGKLNPQAQEDLVEKIQLGGEEYLFYKGIKPDVAFIRATYGDTEGNLSMEKEALILENLAVAQAVHNNGGLVIAQVERIVAAGSLKAKDVAVPGICVDVLVENSDPSMHQQTLTQPYNPSYAGEMRLPSSVIAPLPMSERKVICRRAEREIQPGFVVNLGIGMPEGVATVANELGHSEGFTLTVEAGAIGGVPQSGVDFGVSHNPQAIIGQCEIFDFYQGGGLDVTVLGLAQADERGDINVSKFGSRIAGCGGFIDITHSTKRILFCGTFTAKGLKIRTGDGKLTILQEGSVRKFVKDVEQVTFSGAYALKNGCQVLYITERAVFRLTPEGLELIEVAPGVEIEKDILAQMDFKPLVRNPVLMDAALFTK